MEDKQTFKDLLSYAAYCEAALNISEFNIITDFLQKGAQLYHTKKSMGADFTTDEELEFNKYLLRFEDLVKRIQRSD